MYQPPFKITPKIIELISNISEKVGEINSLQNSPHQIKLRKENRIKTIHSSLAIENNSLSLEQIFVKNKLSLTSRTLKSNLLSLRARG